MYNSQINNPSPVSITVQQETTQAKLLQDLSYQLKSTEIELPKLYIANLRGIKQVIRNLLLPIAESTESSEEAKQPDNTTQANSQKFQEQAIEAFQKFKMLMLTLFSFIKSALAETHRELNDKHASKVKETLESSEECVIPFSSLQRLKEADKQGSFSVGR